MTWDVLGRLRASCSSSRLVDPRDRAVLLLVFSGERRRSEATRQPSIGTETVRRAAEPQRADIATLTCLAIQLGSLMPMSQTRRGGCSSWDRRRGVEWQGQPTPQSGAILWSLQYMV